NTVINIGGTTTSGYDLNMRWALPATGIGRFTFSWQNTILDEYVDKVQTSAGLVDQAREGTERGSPSIAFPEWKSALTADWSLGDFAAAATVRYTDSVTETCPAAARGLGLCSNDPVQNEMDATTYVDLQGSWTPSGLGGGWTFTLGINNVFDEDPPFCFSCELNSFDGGVYDIPGMFWYGRLVARFGKE
ncbi:MAG TPA: TonB-dependent receptor, partial [Steroidobacteraceae bacterium]